MTSPEKQCQDCGALLHSDASCRERFERCLVLEYENPTTFGAVHHLLVASYMLQHNEYSREGWLGARDILVQALERGDSPASLRRKYRHQVDSSNRSWSVTRGEKMPGVEKIKWSMTIADVRLDNTEHYTGDVRRWAGSVLQDTLAIFLNTE